VIKWISIGAALIGLVVAIVAALTMSAEAPEARLASTPSIDPFDVSVAGTGIIEGNSRNVRVSAPEAGLVREVLVDVGEEVERGDVLLRIDARPLEADLLRAQAARDSAAQRLERLGARPREEDVVVARAEVARARAEADDARDALNRVLEAEARDAAAARGVARRRFDAERAEAALARAEGDLARLLDGAWREDIEVAEAELARAAAEVRAIELLIDRRSVRAPISGTVLKRRVEPGEFVAPGDRGGAIVLADLSVIVVRAQINGQDMPDVGRIVEAVARPRSRLDETIPLRLRRVEPLAIPKSSLTGAPAELVDTRVVEVLLEVEGEPEAQLIPGQLVDVFIRLEPEASGSPGDGAPAD